MHKKLIVALLLCCSFAVAETVTVENDATKDLTFTAANDYVVDGVTYVKKAANTAGNELTIDFGQNGCLVASEKESDWGGGVNFVNQKFVMNVSLTLTDADVQSLLSKGDFERVLIDASACEGSGHAVPGQYGGNDRGGIWNVNQATLSLTVDFLTESAKIAWQNAGLGDTSSALLVGTGGKDISLQPELNSFGLALRAGHPQEGCLAPSKLVFVANVPEPATATLSLLALAGLAARRRRH